VILTQIFQKIKTSELLVVSQFGSFAGRFSKTPSAVRDRPWDFTEIPYNSEQTSYALRPHSIISQPIKTV
jgi:hypothetical protein